MAETPAGRTRRLSEGARRVLRRSVEAARAEWSSRTPDRAHDWAEEIDHLLARIDACGEGRGEPEPAAAPGNKFLARRLIEALRLTTLRQWEREGADEDGADYINALAFLEGLAASALPASARELSRRMADPDGFELLVEAAHDLRSPLTSISFLSETLRDGYSGDVNDVQYAQLGLIYSATLAMSSIVSDIVDLARRGKDLVEGPPEAFSLGTMIQDVERLVQPVADIKGIDMIVDHRAHDRVRGHAVAVNRVLLNLTTNALKFTDVGSVQLSTRQVAHDRVRFSVRDTGPGVSDEDRELLYEPFRRSSTRAGYTFSGSGLGLAIVRRVLSAMGSELELDSKEGEGSDFSFEITLPRVTRL